MLPPSANSSFTAILAGVADELSRLKDDGEAHLYEGREEEYEEEVEQHLHLVGLIVACFLDHLLYSEDVISISRLALGHWVII